jgi:hypothetical protein
MPTAPSRSRARVGKILGLSRPSGTAPTRARRVELSDRTADSRGRGHCRPGGEAHAWNNCEAEGEQSVAPGSRPFVQLSITAGGGEPASPGPVVGLRREAWSQPGAPAHRPPPKPLLAPCPRFSARPARLPGLNGHPVEYILHRRFFPRREYAR